MSRLWKDDLGAVVSMELVLISSILVLGLLVGLVSVRDQIMQELADVGLGVAIMQQGYTWSAILGHNSYTDGTFIVDTTDVCDAASDPPLDPLNPGLEDAIDYAALGIDLSFLAMPEE